MAAPLHHRGQSAQRFRRCSMKRPAIGGFGSTDALSPAAGGVVGSTPAVGRESDSSLGRRIRQQPLAWTHVYQSLPDDLIQLLADSLPVADMQRPEGQGCVDHLRRSALLGACQRGGQTCFHGHRQRGKGRSRISHQIFDYAKLLTQASRLLVQLAMRIPRQCYEQFTEQAVTFRPLEARDSVAVHLSDPIFF